MANNDKSQCIGPCYKKGSVKIHPITLTEITSNEYNFCPVHPCIKDGSLRLFKECYETNDEINDETNDETNDEINNETNDEQKFNNNFINKINFYKYCSIF
jgi:hypothetical protein